jgi:hypothetical protein
LHAHLLLRLTPSHARLPAHLQTAFCLTCRSCLVSPANPVLFHLQTTHVFLFLGVKTECKIKIM